MEHVSNELREKIREYLLSVTALRDSMEESVRADPDNVWRYSTYKLYARKYNHIVESLAKLMSVEASVDLFILDSMPGPMSTIAVQQKEHFHAVHVNAAILEAYLKGKLDLKAEQVDNLRNFLAANLRKAIFTPPEKELEIQDAVETLLIGRGLTKGLDYDRETGRVKVSVKEVVPDFVLPKLGMALEVKLAKTSSKTRALVDEINADILAYGKRYPAILFVVYDLGTIRDESEFTRDLEATDGVEVLVVKH